MERLLYEDLREELIRKGYFLVQILLLFLWCAELQLKFWPATCSVHLSLELFDCNNNLINCFSHPYPYIFTTLPRMSSISMDAQSLWIKFCFYYSKIRG
jgi:hypothetical protein